MASPSAVDRTLTTRWENKYLIDASIIPSLRAWIDIFMQPDPHSALQSDLRYQVCTLYLDNPGMDLFIGTVQGHKNRFKLRVRSYADEGPTPIFFEIKKRVNTAVIKVRDAVSREDAFTFLKACAQDSHAATLPETPGCVEFLQAVKDLGAIPKIRIRYRREAWESRSGDPVRVTFDTCVQAKATSGPELAFMEDEPWLNALPVNQAVLEVKFTEAYPAWLHSFIETFDLRLQSIPKYILGADKSGLGPSSAVFEWS